MLERQWLALYPFALGAEVFKTRFATIIVGNRMSAERENKFVIDSACGTLATVPVIVAVTVNGLYFYVSIEITSELFSFGLRRLEADHGVTHPLGELGIPAFT